MFLNWCFLLKDKAYVAGVIAWYFKIYLNELVSISNHLKCFNSMISIYNLNMQILSRIFRFIWQGNLILPNWICECQICLDNLLKYNCIKCITSAANPYPINQNYYFKKGVKIDYNTAINDWNYIDINTLSNYFRDVT